MTLPNEIYLDTNMIHSWFTNLMNKVRKDKEFEIPDVLEFLSTRKFKLFTSNITKVEIVRYLISEWSCDVKEAEEYWDTFISNFNIDLIVVKEIDFNELIEVVKNVPTRKKTLVNLMHLQVAKRNGLYFLTGEEPLKEKYKGYYDKTLTYEDLRVLFS